MTEHARALTLDTDDRWWRLPAAQQPTWRRHPAYQRTTTALAGAAPLVSPAELHALRRSLADVAVGRAQVMQLGDCAESFFDCTLGVTLEKLGVLDVLAGRFSAVSDLPTVRIGRLGGQFAKPRSSDHERVGDVELPVFRGHLVNSEMPTPAARQHDPRRMLWAYQASAKVLDWVRSRRARGADELGPWASHEALVLDYEGALVRRAESGGESFLASTHLPWIGERTRQVDAAHVALLSQVVNPVGCKIGPTMDPDTLVRLCERLDPERVPGRLVLIARIGHEKVADVLPPLVRAVRAAGHPVVWLCDPMHGNTIRSSSGVKTRVLEHVLREAVSFRDIVATEGMHPGGLHLEVAATEVAECLGGPIGDDADLEALSWTLCDPRLSPQQARLLVDGWARGSVT
ncbi:MAG TPA: 3-deoxy-7-phosphoheptulonate synthase [Pseudonocardiaceae bacterium]|nr:3-deoxy-7-phosphoheptulonate synthase [Pseudonocardiaceae bacterium]